MTLIGNVLKRGHAWHWRASDQGDEPNHYDGFVPMADVRRRLFAWQAEEAPVYLRTEEGTFREITDKKAVLHSVTGKVFGVFSDHYTIHQYDESLLKAVERITDSSDLGIDSAGLLREGGKAWVQVSVPENMTSKDGFAFRPTLLASTAHDGSLATTYRRVMQAVVCDNTLQIALDESTNNMVKFRHNKGGVDMTGDLVEVRNALDIVYSSGEEFIRELDSLMAWAVTDEQFTTLVEQMSPIALTDDGDTQSKKSVKVMTAKRENLQNLWRYDERVTPWRNTALGVVQAFTTYDQHISGRSEKRAQRNYNRLIMGQQATADALVLSRLRELTTV
jgi:phage/plasmid-like protein (TIGR03299 family)